MLGKGVYPVKVIVIEGDLLLQLTIVVGILIIIKTRNVCNAFQNSHSKGIIFTLTD